MLWGSEEMGGGADCVYEVRVSRARGAAPQQLREAQASCSVIAVLASLGAELTWCLSVHPYLPGSRADMVSVHPS